MPLDEAIAAPMSPVHESFNALAELADSAHRLQAQHDELQNEFTALGTEFHRVREVLQKNGYDVSFSLTGEVMKGLERASELPQKAEYAPSGV